MVPIVELNSVTRVFGPLVAVDEISLTVSRGEVLGFLGPNGAGKSTTMKMITGFLSPTVGTIKIADHDIEKEPVAIKKMIGYLPEGAPLYGEMTPKSFLKFMAEIRGLSGDEGQLLINQAIRRVNIEKVLDQTIDTLSKGYKRRVGLAQAILHDPPILILDEPTDGLDPNQKFQVRELIRDMAEDKAVIVSTHILEEVEAVCTRAVIIARGRILVDGTPNQLLARSPTKNTLKIEIESKDVAAIQEDLSCLDSVQSVEVLQKLSKTTTVRVIPKNNKNFVIDVCLILREKKYKIEEFYSEKGGLDEVFRLVTEEVNEEDQ